MHNSINLDSLDIPNHGWLSTIWSGILRRKWIGLVVLPTLLVTAYYMLIAADQYESEAHFLVRSTQPSGQPSAGLSQALSMIGGVTGAPSDAGSVSDYLASHDAVAALAANKDLVGKFRRPEADLFSRLTPAKPTPERLLKFYRNQVKIRLDPDSGITAITVRAFRPEDSYELVNDLLTLGEQRVNTLNQRAYDSSLKVARRQLAAAEEAVQASQVALTNFRQGRRNIDPVATGQAQIAVVSGLQTALAQARAQRSAMAGSVSPSSPQFRAIESRVKALGDQVSLESSRLTGGASAIAANVGEYQGLQLRQQFAAKRYDEAAAMLQRAGEQASKQQLFIVRVVEPNIPVKSTYPKAGKVILTVFLGLLLSYSLGWLIVAGVREHAG